MTKNNIADKTIVNSLFSQNKVSTYSNIQDNLNLNHLHKCYIPS